MRIAKNINSFANKFNYEHEQLKVAFFYYVLAKLNCSIKEILCSLPKMTAVAQ